MGGIFALELVRLKEYRALAAAHLDAAKAGVDVDVHLAGNVVVVFADISVFSGAPEIAVAIEF